MGVEGVLEYFLFYLKGKRGGVTFDMYDLGC